MCPLRDFKFTEIVSVIYRTLYDRDILGCLRIDKQTYAYDRKG